MRDVSNRARINLNILRLIAWTLPAIAFHASPIYSTEQRVEVAQLARPIVFIDPDSFPKDPSKAMASEFPKTSHRKSYFTVECQEKLVMIEGRRGPKRTLLRTREYTIDTAQRLWREPGGDLQKLRTKGGDLILVNRQPVRESSYFESFNRSTGKYALYSDHLNVITVGRGTCRHVDLIPFPFDRS
ncbi:hypothetical protein GGD46_005130 [Rhizobium lusitanum]|uniref:Uncharacterized protein n=1 Tax=Rhizobium lusitanum TaxID=293958 RepID=A0A7X0IVJ2_9HYPH|nr:hypothetical protein [Rhizobium lusitanum]